MHIHKLERMTLQEFCDKNGLEIHVTERDPKHFCATAWKEKFRYYANFGNNWDIREGRFRCSFSGEGATPEEAIADLPKKISGKTLVSGFTNTHNRREINVPILI